MEGCRVQEAESVQEGIKELQGTERWRGSEGTGCWRESESFWVRGAAGYRGIRGVR